MVFNFKRILLLLTLCFYQQVFGQSTDENKRIEFTDISIGCLFLAKGIESSYVIHNEEEYEKLYQMRNPFAQKCANDFLPPIDFSQYTLLGFLTRNGGCSVKYRKLVDYNLAMNTYTFTVEVTEFGICRASFSKLAFILIPKIQDNAKVIFKSSVIRVKEESYDE